MAGKNPERYARTVILIEETMPNGNTRLRVYAKNATLNERLGMMTIAAADEIASARND